MFKSGDIIQSIVDHELIISIQYRCIETDNCVGYDIKTNKPYKWTIMDSAWKLYIPKKNHLPDWL